MTTTQIVVPVQTGFAHNWQQTTGELISGDRFYRIIGTCGALAVQTPRTQEFVAAFFQEQA
jgi:hypothetical protein